MMTSTAKLFVFLQSNTNICRLVEMPLYTKYFIPRKLSPSKPSQLAGDFSYIPGHFLNHTLQIKYHLCNVIFFPCTILFSIYFQYCFPL